MSSDPTALHDATLELTILSADLLRPKSPAGLFSKPKTLTALTWLDPAIKRSAKLLPSPPILHIPLSSHTLANPSSSLTLQILSSAPALRLRSAAKVEGASSVPLSSLAAGGTTLALPLRRPHGIHGGFVRVSVRVLWCLGPSPAPATDWGEDLAVVSSRVLLGERRVWIEPSAPIVEEWGEGVELGVVRGRPDGANWPSMPVDGLDAGMGNGEGELREKEGNLAAEIAEKDGRRAVRSFVVGVMSGLLAVVLVGTAGMFDD